MLFSMLFTPLSLWFKKYWLSTQFTRMRMLTQHGSVSQFDIMLAEFKHSPRVRFSKKYGVLTSISSSRVSHDPLPKGLQCLYHNIASLGMKNYLLEVLCFSICCPLIYWLINLKQKWSIDRFLFSLSIKWNPHSPILERRNAWNWSRTIKSW